MTLAGLRTRLGSAFFIVAVALLAIAPARQAQAQECSVENCEQCSVEPTCDACRSGFILNGGANTCNDVNECATSNGGCSVSPAAQCDNIPGSRTCTCPSGFGGDGVICLDVNECATANGGCSTSPAVQCTNTFGSYACGACPGGYSGNGVTCNDVNECATNNGGCAPVTGQCDNLPGTRECTCVSGYTGNGISCNDINECATNNGGCSVSPVVQCTNSPGSRTCGACPVGYGGDGVTCNDINECATANGGCAVEGGACTNTSGSRNCTCVSGYVGDGLTCGDYNECAVNGGGCDPLTTCSNLPGSRTCSACPSGYGGSGDTACTDVNECATENYCNRGTCTNGAGTVTCTCQPGFTGPTCDANGYVPPDKTTATCEKAVVDNVAKYVKCVTGCRVKKAGAELAGKPFDEQVCQADATGGKSCRGAYDKKMASLIAKGTCPACLDQAEQASIADDALDGVIGTKGRAYCEGTVPLQP